jgi:hypothetical protein
MDRERRQHQRILPPRSKEQHVNALQARVVAAHGGLERWNAFTTVPATIVTGGAL